MDGILIKNIQKKIEVNENGLPVGGINDDLDLYAKAKTFEIKGYKYRVKNNNEFNASIPDTVTEIFFTDEIKPDKTEIIDVDADGDGGVVAWIENDYESVYTDKKPKSERHRK